MTFLRFGSAKACQLYAHPRATRNQGHVRFELWAGRPAVGGEGSTTPMGMSVLRFDLAKGGQSLLVRVGRASKGMSVVHFGITTPG